MKKVFFGLAVAAVALSASAFTNVKSFRATAYLTSLSSGVYTYSTGDPNCPSGQVQPCRIQTVGSYVLPTGGSIPAADVNDPTKIQILSRRSAF
jgi:hypothetical protein